MISRCIKFLILSCGLVLLFSFNVSAISLNIPVEQKDVIQTPYWRYYVSGVGDSSWATSTVNRKASDANITRIQLRDNANHDIAFSAGDYIEIGLWVEFYLAENTNNDPLQTGYFDITGASSNCNIIRFDTFSQNWIEGTTVTNTKHWKRWEGSITCSLRTSGTNPTVNLTVKSNGLSSSVFENDPTLVRFGVKSYTVYGVTEQHDVNAEQEQATQDASDQSAEDSDSASSDSEQATQSLLSSITAGVGAITSASPSDCNLDGDMGNFDMGTIDLCANTVPTFISIIGSLIMAIIIIPFAIHVFNLFISITRSFQT